MDKKGIYIKNLSKTFDGVKVLKDISLTIEPGEFFSILGPSGCGKTTLLRILAGFTEPDSGVVCLGDRDITNLPPNLRPINTIFQKYALFPHLTVFENIAFSLRLKKEKDEVIKEEVTKMLKMIDLEEHANKKPNQLSGGQQQRVSIARALINDPKIILADEPTGNLDEETSNEIHNLFRKINRENNQTIIVVTHSRELANITDKRYSVKNGKLFLEN